MPGINQQILIAAIIGVVVGWLIGYLPEDASLREGTLYASAMVGGVFISLLKMVLVPLIFASITVGVANLQAHRQVKRVWVATLVYFIATLALASLLALLATNYFEPGKGMSLSLFADAMNDFEAKQMTLPAFFLHFITTLFQNPFAAFANGSVLAVVVFALFLGVALVMGGENYRTIRQFFQEALDMMLRIIGWIMYLAPLGIMALLIKLVAEQDAALFTTMLTFIALIFGITLFHGAVVLPGILYAFTRRSPLWLWRGSKEALITAFATSSSTATMPVTLRCVQDNLGVRRDVAGFVIPLGTTVNMDGTVLYEAAAALFVANLVGIELNLAQQLVVFFMAMIASVGAPGIPSAGMVTMVMVLQAVGLPAEAIAILLPVDRLLDTIRTSASVEGDIVGSLVVEKIVNDAEGRGQS